MIHSSISKILNSSYWKASIEVLAETHNSFETDDLPPGAYMFYAFDQYGIISGPQVIQVMETTASSLERYGQTAISLAPNPVNEILTIKVKDNDVYHIKITSLNAQILLYRRLEGSTHKLDLPTLKAECILSPCAQRTL